MHSLALTTIMIGSGRRQRNALAARETAVTVFALPRLVTWCHVAAVAGSSHGRPEGATSAVVPARRRSPTRRIRARLQGSDSHGNAACLHGRAVCGFLKHEPHAGAGTELIAQPTATTGRHTGVAQIALSIRSTTLPCARVQQTGLSWQLGRGLPGLGHACRRQQSFRGISIPLYLRISGCCQGLHRPPRVARLPLQVRCI